MSGGGHAQTRLKPSELFPTAAHLIRAQQKDELYLQHLTDCCHDAVRRLLGPRRALWWAAETQALAQLLYYSITTGQGLQTLGEEYCDILQVSGEQVGQPGPVRRGLLVLLQALGPYLADRLLLQPEDGGDAGDEWQAYARAMQPPQHTAAAPAAAAASEATSRQPQHNQQQIPLRLRLAALPRQVRGAAQQAAAPLLRQLPLLRSFIREHGATVLRVHLALFYIYGAYYQPAKRAAGVRYLFLGRAFEGRPSYHILGLLLLTQLGVSGLLWMLRQYGSSGLLATVAGGGMGRQAGGASGRPLHAVLLAEDGKPLAEAAEAASGTTAGEVAGHRKCPLCLSARAHPTATPCGHIFCWQCITDWGSQKPDKPECPLCRADFTPSSLVCIQHADF